MVSNIFIPLLKKANLKVTRQRLLVLSLLQESKQPMDIREMVKKLRKKIDQATVYRILEILKRDGIVNQINFQEYCAYFELKDDKNDHHHIICIECKKINNFTGCEYKKIAEKIVKSNCEFARITNHSFEFFGICKSCA